MDAFAPIPAAVDAPTPELWRTYEVFDDVYRDMNIQQALRAAINGVLAERAALALPRAAGDASTCFHCGETLTERRGAAPHFGTHELQYPACTIDVAAFRRMEAEEARYVDEDADIYRQTHRMASDHQLALQRAEEASCARALKDTGISPHGREG